MIVGALYSFHDSMMYYHHTIDFHPRAENFPIHAHEMYEIFYFCAGAGSFLIEGSEYALEPGCVFLMRAGESHHLKIQPDIPYERMVIHFHPRLIAPFDPQGMLLAPFLEHPLGRCNYYSSEMLSDGFILGCMTKMVSVQTDYGRRLAIFTNLLAILQEVGRCFARMEKVEEDPCAVGQVREIIEYINHNLSSKLSVSGLSSRFFISTSQLNRIFRQATGSSVWEYITIKRLLAARQAILEGQLATTVCGLCGFREYSTFYRAYKKRFGVSPQKDRPKE